MALKICITLFVVLFAKLSYHGTKGGTEDDQLNRQPVKSIKDVTGDIFDCIEISKQPSLDHPLLKNHKIQMKPASLATNLDDEVSLNARSHIALNVIKCPEGTIPILRTEEEDLIRVKVFAEEHSIIHPSAKLAPGVHAAILRSRADPRFFRGAEAVMNIVHPILDFDQQSSLSLVWVENGNLREGEYDGIQAGWTVNAGLNGDYRTRFFIHWTVFSQGKKADGCYNLVCPGFVQISSFFPVNQVFANTSVFDGPQFYGRVSIFQDNDSHNWWVKLNDTNIGYWPKEVLPHLSGGFIGPGGADHVAWGGLTMSSADGISPQMGFGLFADINFAQSGHFLQVQVYDENLNKTLPYGTIDTYLDSPDCYNVQVQGYQGGNKGYTFNYGGPGGKKC